MRQKRFFYLTGSFAFLLYLGLLFAIFALINLKKADKFVFKSETQFEHAIPIEALLLDDPKPKPAEAIQPKPREKQEERQETPALPGLKDLFSDVPDFRKNDDQEKQEREKIERERAQKERLRRLEEEKKHQEEILKQQENIKSLQSSLQNTNQALENINAKVDIKVDIPPNQDKGLHDEWVDKIYRILYENWDFSFYQRTTISVLVTITSNGAFSYRILRYSQYSDYNDKIQRVLERLRGYAMPPYPNGKTISIEVNFKSKVQDE